ncbi:MAG: NPCBM/NEW2 domain-containing protein [Phycisphaerae bacterium]|nr:NPCBM/NEW2 domain-containing protein [Phycisphaerae bacterium]
MNDSTDKYQVIRELIECSLDSSITPEQSKQLNEYIIHFPELRRYYCEYLNITTGMEKVCEDLHIADIEAPEKTMLAEIFLQDILECEIKSKATQSTPTDSNNIYVPRKEFSSSQFWKIMGSVAAMIMFAVFLNLTEKGIKNTPAPKSKPIIASITDEVNARWATVRHIDDQLRSGLIELKEGFASISMNDGVELILQGPCGVELENSNQVFLKYGSLSANVPKNAIGFTVRSQFASVIDYGTEFGVSVDTQGQVETHIFKGKVALRSGSNPLLFEDSKFLHTSQAAFVDKTKKNVARKFQPARFARALPDRNMFAMPGVRLDLADIVGGGNGFGTGELGWAINPDTGQQLDASAEIMSSIPAEAGYHSVEENPFIDGVFVPNGQNGPIKINSIGNTYHFPDGWPVYHGAIANGAWHCSNLVEKHMLQLARKEFVSKVNPAIGMHSNQAITFDLDAIRGSMANIDIVSFETLCGISDTVKRDRGFDPQSDGGKVSFYVIVDGTIQGKKITMSWRDKPSRVSVPIKSNNRFLTLAVTDAGDSTAFDWFMLTEAVLVLN